LGSPEVELDVLQAIVPNNSVISMRGLLSHFKDSYLCNLTLLTLPAASRHYLCEIISCLKHVTVLHSDIKISHLYNYNTTVLNSFRFFFVIFSGMYTIIMVAIVRHLS